MTSELATPQNEFVVQRFCFVGFASASCEEAAALISEALDDGTEAPDEENAVKLEGFRVRDEGA